MRSGYISTLVESVPVVNATIECAKFPPTRIHPQTYENLGQGQQGQTLEDVRRCRPYSAGTVTRNYTVPAGHVAVLWRQPVSVLRTATIQKLNLCGDVESVGEMTIRDWTWNIDVSTAADCTTAQATPACVKQPCQ